MDLEAQVAAGQEALGRLFRQFLAVNGYRHVQFMTMAHAVTGVRWLHSSQITSLKQGGSRNLTCFPLLSIAAVNRRIYEVNAGLAPPPPGTPKTDWEGKQPMLRPDGQPLDLGDFWRIYAGEMEPPLFSDQDHVQFDDTLALKLSQQLHGLYVKHCQAAGSDPFSYLPIALGLFHGNQEQQKLLKGVLLGVTELDADEATDLSDPIADFLSQLQGKAFNERQVFELALSD
jgi:hypothetical protein